MVNRDLILPVIVTGILAFSSFIPVLQVIILSLNGGFLYLFEQGLRIHSPKLPYIINAAFAILFIILYYISEKIAVRILTTIGFVFFALPLLLYASENFIDNESPYFLRFIITGTLIGALLALVSILKSKRTLS